MPDGHFSPEPVSGVEHRMESVPRIEMTSEENGAMQFTMERSKNGDDAKQKHALQFILADHFNEDRIFIQTFPDHYEAQVSSGPKTRDDEAILREVRDGVQRVLKMKGPDQMEYMDSKMRRPDNDTSEQVA